MSIGYDSKYRAKEHMNKLPLYKKDGMWYFWDETWANLIGPYETQEETSNAWRKYCDQLG